MSNPNVIFEKKQAKHEESMFVSKIEVFDSEMLPKSTIYTWDSLVLRIHYYSKRAIKTSSFIIDIYDHKQQRLAVFDSGLKLSINEGFHYIDCYIPQMPFSSGEYFLGVGLAIPNAEFLWRQNNIAIIRVNGKDVYSLGRPPVSTRMVIAIPHEWKSE
jgi:hypothetical protein